MNLKRVISFNIPLILTLLVFVLYASITKLLDNYERSINSDYSIVLVMNTQLNTTDLKQIVDVKEVFPIQREKILSELKEDLTDGTYKMLENKLPYFYNIYLKDFPTSSELKNIQEDLQKLTGIKSVETFSKNHDEVYSLLLFIKTVTLILFVSIIIFTFLIINNQVLIWFYEHQERLDIIKLHGGTIFYGAKPIIKLAFLSALISTFIVIGTYYIIHTKQNYLFNPEILHILKQHPVTFELYEISYLFILAFLISTITVFGVLIKHRIK